MYTTLFTLFAALSGALAYTTPVGDPSGNPIYKPGLNELVPIGKPYTITWGPTTEGTVTLVLLRGPSNNVKPLYPIAEKIPNSGSYVWTPALDLEPDTTHYGLQLIVDATGQYQWSTQFGLEAPAGYSSSSSSSSYATVTVASYTSSSTSYPNATTSANYTMSTTSHYVASTGWPVHNSTIIRPSHSMTVPSSLKTSTKTPIKTTSQATYTTSSPASTTASSSPSAVSTGGAARLIGGGAAGLLGVVAAFAL